MVFVVFTTTRKVQQNRRGAFTLVEAIVAITLLGIGVTSGITALTRFNAFASTSRNATGAYTAVMNQIDAIQSASPFSPQHRKSDGTPDPQIPDDLTSKTETNVPIYKDSATNVVVYGTRTTTVTPMSPMPTYNGATVYMYLATVKVDYTYLGRKYSYSMSTVRTSDE